MGIRAKLQGKKGTVHVKAKAGPEGTTTVLTASTASRLLDASTRNPSDRKVKRNKRESKVSPVFIPHEFNLYGLLYQATAFSWFSSHKPRWLTNTVLLVPVELIARMAKAFKSPHRVLTAVLTTTIVHAAFIYIWGGKGKHHRQVLAFVLPPVPSAAVFRSTCHVCRLTSAVGQSIQGVAFVAETLKTTRGVHTCVITCALEKTLVYICNHNQAGDMKAGQVGCNVYEEGFPDRSAHTYRTWCLMVITGQRQGSFSPRQI